MAICWSCKLLFIIIIIIARRIANSEQRMCPMDTNCNVYHRHNIYNDAMLCHWSSIYIRFNFFFFFFLFFSLVLIIIHSTLDNVHCTLYTDGENVVYACCRKWITFCFSEFIDIIHWPKRYFRRLCTKIEKLIRN